MAYTTFSTNNANYVLQLGNHIEENKQVDIFEGIDALVIENCGSNLKNDLKTDDLQYKMPSQYCADNLIPVFGVDVDRDSLPFDFIDSDFQKMYTMNLPIIRLLNHYAYESEKKVNEIFLEIYAFYNHLLQNPVVTGRDAISARKIEDFVAPLIAERLQRKPYLGLIYGVAHMGLKKDLQSILRRGRTINNLQNKNWKSLHEEDLNKVHEANYNGKTWTFTNHKIDLF